MKQRKQRLCLVSEIDYFFWDCIVYDDFSGCAIVHELFLN